MMSQNERPTENLEQAIVGSKPYGPSLAQLIENSPLLPLDPPRLVFADCLFQTDLLRRESSGSKFDRGGPLRQHRAWTSGRTRTPAPTTGGAR